MGDEVGKGEGGKVQQAAEEKQRRLAEALRANLHRRKAQARARNDAETQEGDGGDRTEQSSS